MRTINLSLPLELTFDPELLEKACGEIKPIEARAVEAAAVSSEEFLDALLTVLLFRRLEKERPGTIKGLMATCQAAAPAPSSKKGKRS